MEDVAEAAFKLAFRAIVLLLRVIGQLLLEVVVQTFCYWTARVAAPIVSLGYVSVETIRQLPSRSNFWGVTRETNGGVRLSTDMAAALGLVFWIVLLIGLAMFFRTAS